MNTESLQKHFKSEYESFFAKNDLVVSGCFSFSPGTMDIGHRSRHLRIKSKLPIKMYVGINKNFTNKVEIKNVLVYDMITNTFQEESFSEIHKQQGEIITIIEGFLKEKGIDTWVDISILSESPRWHWLWFSGTFWAILSAWLHLITWDISYDAVEDIQKFENSEIFKEICLLWQKIDFVARHKNLGVNSIFPLLSSSFPYIFYSEKFDTNIHVNGIKNIKYMYFPLNKLFEEKEYLKEFPVDVAIIFTGQKQKTDIIEHSIINDKKKCDELWDFIEKDLLQWCDFKKSTNFYKFKEKGYIYEQLSNTATIMWIKTIDMLKKIYTQWFDTNVINNFIDQINVLRNTLSLVEKQEHFAEDFIYNFKKNQWNNDSTLWIRPIYSGKNWGWYMVVMKEEGRKAFEKTIHDLKEKYPNITIIHASRMDSQNTDWIKINQYIAKWLFSVYVDKNKVFIKTNSGENKTGDYNEIISSEKEGLLLDTIKNKMYRNWIKLNSKDIPSQTTTINILDKLLDNIERDVSNKEFEISSYSKNKNEMLGKIVIPLIEFIEKKSQHKLPLICKWSIYDFYLKLNPINIRISVIKRI